MNNALTMLRATLAATEPAQKAGFADAVESLVTALQKKHGRGSFDITKTVRASISSPRIRGPYELEETLMLRDSESVHHAWVRVNLKNQTVVLDVDGSWYPVPAPATKKPASVLASLVSVYKNVNGSSKVASAATEPAAKQETIFGLVISNVRDVNMLEASLHNMRKGPDSARITCFDVHKTTVDNSPAASLVICVERQRIPSLLGWIFGRVRQTEPQAEIRRAIGARPIAITDLPGLARLARDVVADAEVVGPAGSSK